jgi:hypothetical protein
VKSKVNIFIFCFRNSFGFGIDHDAKTLASIGELGNGSFTFIENTDKVCSAFATVLGSLISIAATSITLNIQTQNGVTIDNVYGKYSSSISSEKTSASVLIPDMLSGEKKDIIFLMTLPKVEKVGCEVDIFSAFGTFRHPNVGIFHDEYTISMENISLFRPEVEFNPQMNVRLQRQRYRLRCADVVRDATNFAEGGQLPKAQNLISKVIQELKDSSLSSDEWVKYYIQELDSVLLRFRDERTYQTCGFAFATQLAASM